MRDFTSLYLILMLDSLFIVADNGDVIYQKFYQYNMDHKIYVPFVEKLLKLKQYDNIPTIFIEENSAFINVKHDDMYLLTVTNREKSPIECVCLLQQLIDMMIVFFDKRINVTFLRANIVRLYRIMEETTLNGNPISINPNILKKKIKGHGAFMSYVDHVAQKNELVDKSQHIIKNIKNMASSSQRKINYIDKSSNSIISKSCTWRSSDIHYDDNELFVDVVEYFSMLIDKNDQVIDMSVHGKIVCDSSLSYVPLIEIQFNKNQHLNFDQIFFHYCVDKNIWETKQIVNFVPLDGRFTLLEYFFNKKALTLPIIIHADIKLDTTGDIEITANISHNNFQQIKGLTLTIFIPSISAKSNSFLPSLGKYEYNKQKGIIIWKIGDIDSKNSSHKILKFKAHFEIDTNKQNTNLLKQKSNINVKVDCKFSKSTVSGLKIAKLNFKNINYKPFKGVRYTNKARLFEHRFC